jgi:preprotein translocase subunit SecB
MKDKPEIQKAFRLIHFIVNKVAMDAIESFEDKNEDGKEKLKLEVGTSIGFSEEDKKVFTVEYEIQLESSESNIKLQMTAIAFFEAYDELDEDFKNSNFLKINAPAIGFPFVRSFINTLTTNAGLPSLILPTFNFLNREKK